MTRAQQVLDVADGRLGQQSKRLWLDLQEGAPRGLDGADPLGGEQTVRRLVGAEREQVGVREVGHAASLRPRTPWIAVTVVTSPRRRQEAGR
jgi:hypothetical protein